MKYSFGVIILFVICGTACGPSVTDKDVYGRYEARFRDGREVLILQPDFKYVHINLLHKGAPTTNSATWKLYEFHHGLFRECHVELGDAVSFHDLLGQPVVPPTKMGGAWLVPIRGSVRQPKLVFSEDADIIFKRTARLEK